MKRKLQFLLMMLLLPWLVAQAKIHVFTCGDSTMANKTSKTERGWGMLFPWFVDESQVTVTNKAADGRSTLSFINEGRWQSVVDALAEGDYVLIQFGHNDEKTSSDLHTDPQTTYKENLTRFVNETKAKGAHPVLLTPIVRRIFGADGNILDEHTEYANAVRELAEKLNIPLIDMNVYSALYENIAGVVGTRSLHEYFPGTEIDNTHLCQLGAYITARCVAEQIAANDKIDIPLNANPSSLDGAYTSTLDYAQHQFSANYPWEKDVPTSLSAIDERVRQLRYEQRQGLKNYMLPADASFVLVNAGFDEGLAWYNSVQATRPMGWTLEYTGTAHPNLSSTAKPQDSETPVIAAGYDHYIMWGLTGSGKFYQKVEGLADGEYEVSAEVCFTGSVSPVLYANDANVVVDKDQEASVRTIVKDGKLELGVSYENASNGTIDLENFKLVKVPGETSDYEKNDVTAKLKNPGFEGSKTLSNKAPEGWTLKLTKSNNPQTKISTGAKANGLIPANQNHYQLYQYNGNLVGKFYQTVEGLEDGHYILGADLSTSFAGELYLYANGSKVQIVSGNNKRYEVEVDVNGDKLETGLDINFTTAQNTIDVDAFTLTKVMWKGAPTGIQELFDSDVKNENSAYYDLYGRKYEARNEQELSKGIYILHGKKFVKQ